MHDSFKTKTRLKVGSASYTLLQPPGPREEVPEGQEAPVLAPDPPREPPPPRGRPRRHEGGHRGARDAGRQEADRPRDRLPPRARPPAGLHRRPRRRRPRRDARGDRRDGRRPREDQPARAGRPRHRPLGHGRPVRDVAGVRREREARVRAQPRALRLPPLGAERLPELPRRPAGHRHLPPGEPRVPRERRLPGEGKTRLPRHARRHRLAHHDDQRARRPRLGRRRHRGRGRAARPAAVDAHPRGGRLQARRDAAAGRDRDRPRPHRHADAPQEGRRREVRRVLRPRRRGARAARPRDDREHGARVRRDDRLLPGRRRDARLPALHRPPGEGRRARRGLLQGAGPLPDDGRARARSSPTRSSSTSDVEPSLAGPKRPQDRVPLKDAKKIFRRAAATSIRRIASLEDDGDARTRSSPHAANRHRSLRAPDSRRDAPSRRPRDVRAPARRGRHRRDHLVHEHLEPGGHARRRPPREEGGRARALASSRG